MQILALVLTAVTSYLLGSLNSSIIVVRLLKHEDIREHGSKNAGLTNTLRCYGKIPALLTLIGDLAKGIVAVILSRCIFTWLTGGDAHIGLFDAQAVGYAAGFFAMIGHIFPLYYGFKGGKGVLVSASILIVIDPITFFIVIPFFILIVAVTRYVSLGSILAAAAYPIVTFCVNYFLRGDLFESSLLYAVLAAFSGALIIYMHRSNIERLKSGTENKLGAAKKE